MLFATHYLEEADAYADRIVLIRKGEIVADGTSAQVKASRPAGPCGPRCPAPARRRCAPCPARTASRCGARPCSSTPATADAVARYLLTETDAHDLEIASRGLEEAFLALTGDDGTDHGHDWRETGDHRRPQPSSAAAGLSRRWAGSTSRS